MVFGGGSFGGAMFGGALYWPVPYHRELMVLARQLQKENRFEMTVIAAAMAGEVLSEGAMSSNFKKRGLDDLKRPIQKLFRGHNLSNGQVRDIYEALTGDTALAQETFWERYKKLVETRNGIIHRGEKVDPASLDGLLNAADAFIAYLEPKL